MPGKHIIEALQRGDPNGSVWRPAECDTSIRPGWFHHPAEDGRVRSADRLMDLYFRSVGRNGKLLLNVPPTRDGVLHPTDVARLQQFAEMRREAFAQDLAAARRIRWTRPNATTASGVLDIGRPRSFGIVRLEEPIENGQTVARYSIHGAGSDRVFRPLAKGTTVGHARLDRVVATDVRYVRIDIEEAVAEPGPLKIRLFA